MGKGGGSTLSNTFLCQHTTHHHRNICTVCSFCRLVSEHGEGNWSNIARQLNTLFEKPVGEGRIGKQCRERWNHHLRPDIRKDTWTEEEEWRLISAHQQ